jgi:antirestriction protein ArdC
LAAKTSVYDIVTERIMEALEQGIVPWQRPWTSQGGPRNLNSKRPYRGINAFLLALSNYSSPFWTTYEGAKKAGGNVKKGEKGTIVVWWNIFEVEDTNAKGQKVTKKVAAPRYYRVWNSEQCEGVTVPEIKKGEFDVDEAAQVIIDDMPDAPTISFGGDRAYYAPLTDDVQLPTPESFKSTTSYYATAFHELVHSTGHSSRLARVKDWTGFGSDPYAKEELVAEMGAAMLCGMAGLEAEYDNNAAYIQSWLRKLNQDKRLVFQAASAAQKAADFILNREAEEPASTEAEVAVV